MTLSRGSAKGLQRRQLSLRILQIRAFCNRNTVTLGRCEDRDNCVMAISGHLERLPACLNGNWVLRCYGCGTPGGAARTQDLYDHYHRRGIDGFSTRQDWGLLQFTGYRFSPRRPTLLLGD